MFGLGAPGEQTFVADVFVLPPVVPHVLESEPLEEVALFRDEMANLVWGVERVVQGAVGRARRTAAGWSPRCRCASACRAISATPPSSTG